MWLLFIATKKLLIKVRLYAKIEGNFFKEIQEVSDEVLNEIEQKFVSCVTQALESVKVADDPKELDRYRKLFRKSVPFTMRSYVASYLAKQLILNGKPTSNTRSSNKEGYSSFHQSKPKIILGKDEAKVLFFSIGRKRGVSPKDIITLIMQNTSIPREHIGEIKLLDNYCFVQIMKENAESVIAGLNNSRYRGKPLSVSYATNREDDILITSDEMENKAEI
ncbi:MAG: DbpA RNA binding domain-containing protein [Treponema sp.]